MWQRSAKHYYRSYLLHLLQTQWHTGASAGNSQQVKHGMWYDEVADLLHLSLSAIFEEDSKRNRCFSPVLLDPNHDNNNNHDHNRGSGGATEATDGRPPEGPCALSRFTEKYEHSCVAGEGARSRNRKRSGRSEVASCLLTVRSVIDRSSGLTYTNSADVAALCAVYGCHKEALMACRHHLSCHEEAGGEVTAVLLQCLQTSLCRLVRELLHVQAASLRSFHPEREAAPDPAAAGAAADRALKSGSLRCEISEDVVLAVRLLRVALSAHEEAADVTGHTTLECRGDCVGGTNMFLSSIVSCLMSVPLCLCPSNIALSVQDEVRGRDRFQRS